MTASGSCLCGGVRFEVTGPLRPVVACHCVQCRKTSGHYVAATSALTDHLRFAADESLRWYRASTTARRGFCSVCGSSLFWAQDGGPRMSIHAGALDGATGLAVIGPIFCADKGDYYALPDDLPQAPQDDPELTTR
jgi:hypothetical protein